MALARLCIGPKSTTRPLVDFHAFIVDHRARVGSTEEAKLVASRLEEWGMFLDSSAISDAETQKDLNRRFSHYNGPLRWGQQSYRILNQKHGVYDTRL